MSKSLEELKQQAKGVIGKGRNVSRQRPITLPKEDDTQPTDVMLVLHSEEIEVVLDLLYDALQGKHSKEQKRIMLNVIKHLES